MNTNKDYNKGNGETKHKRTIQFEDTNETFNIMLEDEIFIICSRFYTVDESKKNAKEWDNLLQEFLEENNIDTCGEYSNKYFEYKQKFMKKEGERPTELDEDTQCYTIVNKKEQIRVADNYYNRYNYLDIDECQEALKELHKGLDSFSFVTFISLF
jgi:hypothetical protein